MAQPAIWAYIWSSRTGLVNAIYLKPTNRFFVPTHSAVVDELRRRVDDWDAYLDTQIAREPHSPKG